MENWGLITFRDSTLLYSQETTNAQTKEQIALIVCHEIAHQVFNLLALDDFSEAAMENWGLITFRDSTLLYSQETTNAQTKEQIALIVCHEIAHQWFGNLVTMDWWNDLWLNEGFANYMEYKCVDNLFPDWNIMTRFYSENIAYSQEPDGLRSSRAVSSNTSNNTNLMGLFDAISYHKVIARESVDITRVKI
ncbi:unnamed protein product [Strongylus vulgaris]|uniref:Peptidase M1 membrane alanine aminopeptidase domain-containing protein n=1 Tax=Strongylus vulgaris TaxID=40348 RepID=A0A3P7J7C3_STRVU|nr:unnamed protein product [Strongylus vulgaris]